MKSKIQSIGLRLGRVAWTPRLPLLRGVTHFLRFLVNFCWLILVVACCSGFSFFLLSAPATAKDGSIVRLVTQADRLQLSDPRAALDISRAQNLKGLRCCVSGWAEFDVHIENPGWYELWTWGGSLETLVDPADDRTGEPYAFFVRGSGIPREPDKVGNLWLTSGRHRLRFETSLWNGFSDFRSFELRPSSNALEGTISIRWPREGQIFRAGACPRFELKYGGRTEAAQVFLETRDKLSGLLAGSLKLSLPSTSELQSMPFEVPCNREGFFEVSVAHGVDGSARAFAPGSVKGFEYEVVETTRLPYSHGEASRADVTIDCTRLTPDYASGETFIRSGPSGAFRESSSTGWFAYQRLPPNKRQTVPEPSWFAYRIPGLDTGRHYRIEVEYPDDANRTFGVVLREANQRVYPPGIAIDTGGPFPNSGRMQVGALEFWARDHEPRLVFAPLHDGMRAACSRIHVVSVEPSEPAVAAPQRPGSREFVHWYEEGINFIDLFGAVDRSSVSVAHAADRWAGTVAAMGGTTLMPTVLVYGGQLYPSRFNRAESIPDRDELRRILLSAERFHLKVIPELHPRSDELVFGLDEAAARRRLLVSKDGADNYYTADGKSRNLPPHYNVLQPEIQEWLVGMVGELADRYRDSPALEGISLRYMQWSNAALDNLVSLDWGYDDTTVESFVRDSGATLPVSQTSDPKRFRRRYAWLTGPAREAWVQWRCDQISSLFRHLVARVRAARPDLKLYLHVFPADENRPFGPADTPVDRLRAAGIDPITLASIPGLEVVDSSASYGRNLPDAVAMGLLDAVRRPQWVNALHSNESGGRYISTHRYLEMTDVVIPPAKIGFPLQTRGTWASLAANPPGNHAVERYAAELAYGDALMLGDGGNGLISTAPEIRAFLEQFTQLPARPFATVTPTDSPIAVRQLRAPHETWMYAVNATGRPVMIEISLNSDDFLLPAGTANLVVGQGRLWRISLPPYGLFCAKLARGQSIRNADVVG